MTLKIKPALAVGGKMIKYPDYITVDKAFTNKALMSYLGRFGNRSGTADTLNNRQNTEIY